MKPKYDMLWKGMIEEIMADLLLFVDPDIGKDVDLERGFEYLDKELAEIYPEAESSNLKVVDKLVKVFLRDGNERCILLHLEIQGKDGKEFPARMFEYFLRLRKRGRPVAAIAVLTGRKGRKKIGVYEDRCLWSTVRYEYKTLRIADYNDETLMASVNPFAVVMLVAKEVLLKDNGTKEEQDNVLYEHKELIARLIKDRMGVYGENKTRVMMSFLNNYVVFKTREINLKFMERTDQIFERKNTMGYFEQLAEIRRREGVEEGRREGLKEGRLEGVQEGLEKAVQKMLTNTDFSVEKIATLMEVPVAVVKKIKKELDAK